MLQFCTTSGVSLLFLLLLNPNCRLYVSNVSGVMLVCLKATVLVLKGVSLCIASAKKSRLLICAFPSDVTVFWMGEGEKCPWWMFQLTISLLAFL